MLWIGQDTPGYTVASSAQQHSLVLLDVGAQHQGTYTCIASNAAGQALCSASLHVSGCEWAWAACWGWEGATLSEDFHTLSETLPRPSQSTGPRGQLPSCLWAQTSRPRPAAAPAIPSSSFLAPQPLCGQAHQAWTHSCPHHWGDRGGSTLGCRPQPFLGVLGRQAKALGRGGPDMPGRGPHQNHLSGWGHSGITCASDSAQGGGTSGRGEGGPHLHLSSGVSEGSARADGNGLGF